MSSYYLKVDNRLYQVVDSNTDRIIATFISENDAQTFMEGLYEKMFKGKREIIGHQIFMTKQGQKFVNNSLFGESITETIDSNSSYLQNEENNFDDEVVDDTNLDWNSELSDTEEQSFDDSDFNNDETQELTMQKFGTPVDYLNIIEKPSKIINNFDDNSLGEIAQFKNKHKVESKKELENQKKLLDEENYFPPNVYDENEYDESIEKTTEIAYLKNNEVNEIEKTTEISTIISTSNTADHSLQNTIPKIENDINLNENIIVDENEYDESIEKTTEISTIISTSNTADHSLQNTIPKIENDINLNENITVDETNLTIDKTLSLPEILNLDEYYKNIINSTKKETISDNGDFENLDNSKTGETNLSVDLIEKTKDVIDFGPEKEGDDIFSPSFRKANAKTDIDIEKAILAGDITILSKKARKKAEKQKLKEEKWKKKHLNE